MQCTVRLSVQAAPVISNTPSVTLVAFVALIYTVSVSAPVLTIPQITSVGVVPTPCASNTLLLTLPVKPTSGPVNARPSNTNEPPTVMLPVLLMVVFTFNSSLIASLKSVARLKVAAPAILDAPQTLNVPVAVMLRPVKSLLPTLTPPVQPAEVKSPTFDPPALTPMSFAPTR